MKLKKFGGFINESESDLYTISDLSNALNMLDYSDYFVVNPEKSSVELEYKIGIDGSVEIECNLLETHVDFDEIYLFSDLKKVLDKDPESKGPKFNLKEIKEIIDILYQEGEMMNHIKVVYEDPEFNTIVERPEVSMLRNKLVVKANLINVDISSSKIDKSGLIKTIVSRMANFAITRLYV